MLKGSKGKVSSKIQQGFTIIEVIIVLVIAAIIMLAVFLVVPQLQRTQRNTRNQAVARQAFSAGEQYAANNNGSYPTTIADVEAISGSLKNASNTQYTLVTAAYPTTVSTMYMSSTAAACTNASTPGTFTNTGTKFAIVITQEDNTSATNGKFCVSN